MKLIIFAGGAGTRLWPISRQNSPKQFEKLKESKSTLQMAVDRVRCFGMENIYISTNEKYEHLVKEQIPDLFEDHLMLEPAKRDLAAAVGLALFRLKNKSFSGTVAVLWSDHFVEYPEKFQQALYKSEKLINKNPNRFIFLAEQPRFPNENLGWMKIGDELSNEVYSFEGWKYRPEKALCEKMFASGNWLWNPGYFIFNIDFVLNLYKKHNPKMYDDLQRIVENEHLISEVYPKLEAMHFDKAILEKIDSDEAVVMKVDFGWSDPGTLYALKETLEPDLERNYTKGNVISTEDKDCLIYNEEDDKLVVTHGLDGIMVVNTDDVTFICHKDQISNMHRVLEKLKKEDLENYL
ncbi:MAG: hypothetical protein GF349_04145 [Candidatus Magasanikbacteria bacterium]|nr:hypothetical protein [Candidatus Magasanikbacteria bacterium]